MTVALLVLTVANACLQWGLRNTVPHELHRRLLGRRRAEVVALGNSVIVSGFDAKTFSEVSGAAAVNAGLGAAGFVQQYVAWRLASDGRTDLKKLILGTFDHSLTNYESSHWTNWHSNNALPFYCDPAWSERYVCLNRADQLAFRVLRRVPLFVERGGLWTKVERIRREQEAVGLKNVENNRFGRLADFALLLEQDEGRFKQQSLNAIQTRAQLAAPVADILHEARAKGISTVVVMMPLPAARRPLYAGREWIEYVEYLKSLLARTDTQLVEAVNWGEGDDFDDSVHLSKSGAAKFTARLAEMVK